MGGKDDWINGTLTKTTSRFPLRKERFERSGGEGFRTCMVRMEPPPSVGFPGEYPFTRVPRPPCIVDAFGPCGNMPVLGRKNPMSATSTC